MERRPGEQPRPRCVLTTGNSAVLITTAVFVDIATSWPCRGNSVAVLSPRRPPRCEAARTRAAASGRGFDRAAPTRSQTAGGPCRRSRGVAVRRGTPAPTGAGDDQVAVGHPRPGLDPVVEVVQESLHVRGAAFPRLRGHSGDPAHQHRRHSRQVPPPRVDDHVLHRPVHPQGVLGLCAGRRGQTVELGEQQLLSRSQDMARPVRGHRHSFGTSRTRSRPPPAAAGPPRRDRCQGGGQ
ncbi:hypothetical protein BCF44_13518 [Kutzneria buriramensis]|uniref:Uncharacterized protein n=1 Tax=Kutzneria buriramensis TaxID=1045776 RepID=A0A3E0GSS6_9PSEU|nr:hypothetical protein BCF44_13518 [Kutzneria buriramensis]